MVDMLPFETSIERLFDGRQRFDSRPDIGPAEGLISRELRWFQGNPIRYAQATSANFNAVTILPNESRARTAVMNLIGAPIFYRDDGTTPIVNADQTLGINGQIILTGMESIQNFVFIASSITPATLCINFYD
jgi:hypothetical protein